MELYRPIKPPTLVVPLTGTLLLRLVAATPSIQPAKPPTSPVAGAMLALELVLLVTLAVVEAA